MQQGEYINDRIFGRMLRRICQSNGIAIDSFSDDWIHELTKDAVTGKIIGYKFGLNDSAAASIAQDKVATYQLLTRHGIKAVPHFLARTKVASAGEWKQQNWDKGIVAKPLVGTSGHGVRLFGALDEAETYMAESGIEAWAVSPYMKLISEVRFIVLDGEVLLQYQKIPVLRGSLLMFNLGLGATPQDVTVDASTLSLVKDAIKSLGVRVAAIDIVTTAQDETMVLEINEGIMMEHYMRNSEEYMQRGYDVYGQIITKMMQPSTSKIS